MTLPLFFLKSANLSVKQRASLLLPLRLSSFRLFPATTSLSRSSDQAGKEPVDKLRASRGALHKDF
jgi:hypothetical protein